MSDTLPSLVTHSFQAQQIRKNVWSLHSLEDVIRRANLSRQDFIEEGHTKNAMTQVEHDCRSVWTDHWWCWWFSHRMPCAAASIGKEPPVRLLPERFIGGNTWKILHSAAEQVAGSLLQVPQIPANFSTGAYSSNYCPWRWFPHKQKIPSFLNLSMTFIEILQVGVS